MMKRHLISSLLLLLCWRSPGIAQILPPCPILLNDMNTTCAINHGGRVILKYDLRTYGAKSLRLELFSVEDTDKPSWAATFDQVTFQGRLALGKLPVGVYQVRHTLLGENGKPLRERERYMTLVYGGDKAWARYDKFWADRLAANSAKVPFAGELSDSRNNLVLETEPSALVLRPGQSAVVRARIKSLSNAQPLSAAAQEIVARSEFVWKLEGRGNLQSSNGPEALFKCEGTKGSGETNREAVIRVEVAGHPELKGNIWVIVSETNVGGEKPK